MKMLRRLKDRCTSLLMWVAVIGVFSLIGDESISLGVAAIVALLLLIKLIGTIADEDTRRKGGQ